MIIIGFSGKMGAGKSTCAYQVSRSIRAETGEPCTVVGFGDALKVIAAELYGFPVSLAYTEHGKEKFLKVPKDGVRVLGAALPVPISQEQAEEVSRELNSELQPGSGVRLRQILQTLGTAMRRVDTRYWVNALARAVIGQICIIIDDVRFPEEAEWIHSQRGCVINVFKPFMAYAPIRYIHESEVGIDGTQHVDTTYCNDGESDSSPFLCPLIMSHIMKNNSASLVQSGSSALNSGM